MSAALQDDVVFVHSSDLHLSADPVLGAVFSDSLAVLRAVLAAATAARADFLILAGDTFDHNRQPPELVERAVQVMCEFGAPIVILPGNHDPLTADSVYRHPRIAVASNVCVLGLTVEEAVTFPDLEVEARGKAHQDYFDMSPLPNPPFRSTRWRIVAAHGHYVEEPEEPGRLLGSWLIRREELVAAGADYVALGHWNRAARVGDGQIQAYYSGSPEYAGTVNVVRLRSKGAVEVTRVPLHGLATRVEVG
jgi:DNA repair exonuclease SbcCD nuclease subunit